MSGLGYGFGDDTWTLSQLGTNFRSADTGGATLQCIRAIIKKQAPQLQERMHYKMLGYGVDDTYAFHLNAQSGYVSLYVGGASKIDPSGELLKGLNVSNVCAYGTI